MAITTKQTDAEAYEEQRRTEEQAAWAEASAPTPTPPKPEFKSVGGRSGIHVQVNGPLALVRSLKPATRSPEQLSKHGNGPKHDWEVVRLRGDEPLDRGSEALQERIGDEQRLTGDVPFTHAKREARKKILAAKGELGS